MYPAERVPPQAVAWQGWPVGWAVPEWGSASSAADADRLMSQVDTAFACVDLNSAVLSTMPAYMTRGGAVIPSLPWLENPEPRFYTCFEEFAKQLFWSYQLGEAFVYCLAREANDPERAPYWDPAANRANHPDGWPTRFVIVPPWDLKVEWDDDRQRRVYTSGENDEVDPRDILHVRYASWPRDPRGRGPLDAARTRVIAAAALIRFTGDLASRGGVPWAVITHPDRLTATQAGELQQQWLASRMNALGLPAVMSGGISLETLQVSPRDMSLHDLLTFQESRIAVLFGVPPFLVGLPSGGDSMTYSNVSSLFDYHWRAGLRPKAQPVMSALSGWATFAGTRVELNRDEYVRPGLNERAQAYAMLHGIEDETGRAMTVAEIRERERFNGPPSPVGLTSGSGGA